MELISSNTKNRKEDFAENKTKQNTTSFSEQQDLEMWEHSFLEQFWWAQGSAPHLRNSWIYLFSSFLPLQQLIAYNAGHTACQDGILHTDKEG